MIKHAVFFAAAIALAAGAPHSPAVGQTKVLKIAAIQADRPQQQPWAAALHDALVALQKEDPNIKFQETFDAFDPTKAEPQIRQFIADGYTLILAHNFALSDIAKKLAKEHPNVLFEVSNFEDPVPPNLTVATESYLQAGYATCWLLSRLSKTGKIGIIGVQPIPYQKDMVAGCERGTEDANSSVELIVAWTGSWTDLQKSREQAQNLVSQGADGLFASTAGTDSLGMLAFCEQNPSLNCSAWGADARQYAPKTSVTSVIIDWAVPLRGWVEQARTGKFKVDIANLTFGNKGLKIQPFEGATGAKVPADIRKEFMQVVEQLAAGKVKLPDSVAHPGLP